MHVLDARFRLRGAGVTGALRQLCMEVAPDFVASEEMAPQDLEHDTAGTQSLHDAAVCRALLQRAAGLVPDSLPPESSLYVCLGTF